MLHKKAFRLYYLSFSIYTLGILLFILSGCKNTNEKETIINSDSEVHAEKADSTIWVGTWGTAPQLVEPHNMPPEPGLNNNTIRQVVRVSIGGDSLRLRFSNEFSTDTVIMKKVSIAVSKEGSVIDTTTIKELKFNGKSEATINPGIDVTSDPFSFNLKPRTDIAITIYFGKTSSNVTGHPGSRTTSYIVEGDKTTTADLADATETDHWYNIKGIDVKAPASSGVVVILGNSITDGRGSGTNKQNRWPDILSERLLSNPETINVGVLNMGIGGNCVLKECLGASAIDRFERDVLSQHNVRWLIILEGVNDLGQAPDRTSAAKVSKEIIEAYQGMINKAHAHNIKVYGATILPFNKSFYYKDYREEARKTINEWIRNSGEFDAVIDFAKALQSPEDASTILSEAHSGDFLHPNENGYKMMGEAVDLGLFE